MTKPPTNPPPDEPQASTTPEDRPSQLTVIQTRVLAVLGRPPGLYRVAVIPLWQNYYRVNVLIGTDPMSVQIAHSYFVTADETGRILTATPPLVRLYQ